MKTSANVRDHRLVKTDLSGRAEPGKSVCHLYRTDWAKGDILVNNAGIWPGGYVTEIKPAGTGIW
ncbi:hypothetical protein LAD64_23540 [Klebsiella pneumoniae]|nr:hypothetical protein [Klebsiella pneumoniae]